MAMKEQQRSVYRTMQGKEVDMHKLAMQNEMTVAVGNARVNARGDELGPGGKIIRKREDILREAQSGAQEEILPVKNTVEVAPPTVAKEIPSFRQQSAANVEKPARKKIDDMDPEGNE